MTHRPAGCQGSPPARLRTSAGRSPRPSRVTGILGVFVLVLVLTACAGLGRGGPAEATRENRISLVAELLQVEDRRDYDPIVVGRASASKDPWVRSRAALTCGRLRDVEASIYLPVLLRDQARGSIQFLCVRHGWKWRWLQNHQP